MDIKKIVSDGQIELVVSGILDTSTAFGLEQEVRDISGVHSLILNLENLTYMSTAGLRVILIANKRMSAIGGSMIVRKPNDAIMKGFKTSGLVNILKIEE